MSDGAVLDAVPLWLMFLLTVGLIQVGVETGFRIGVSRNQKASPEKDAPVGAIVGATLGLLAFMLAFTFGLAASRFEARRQVVLDEANAIGTTYLRAAMLPQPQGDAIRALLREYVEIRLDAVQHGAVERAMKRSTEIHDEMWRNAQSAAAKNPSPITAIFIQSLNEVIDLHSARVQAALRSRIPVTIWAVLYFVALLAMLALGYQIGLANSKRSIAAVALVLTFSAVMLLIADLDRPGEGLLKTSQQTFVDLLDFMKVSN
jgi:hypothetical protein